MILMENKNLYLYLNKNYLSRNYRTEGRSRALIAAKPSLITDIT